MICGAQPARKTTARRRVVFIMIMLAIWRQMAFTAAQGLASAMSAQRLHNDDADANQTGENEAGLPCLCFFEFVFLVHRFSPPFGYHALVGSKIADGCAGSWYTVWSAAFNVVAVASGSPLPVFRAKRGCAPLDTWTRMRWPRRNR